MGLFGTCAANRPAAHAVGFKPAACLLAVVMLWVAPTADAAEDELSQEDHDALIYHLNIIANDPGWPQGSVDAANAILSSSEYTPVAWDTFFTEYFSDHPFTDYLFNYLLCPGSASRDYNAAASLPYWEVGSRWPPGRIQRIGAIATGGHAKMRNTR